MGFATLISFIILQYYNGDSYCPDFDQETVYHILVANSHTSIEDVLNYLRLNIGWIQYWTYEEDFGVTHIDYSDDKCQLYTSLYKSVVKP